MAIMGILAGDVIGKGRRISLRDRGNARMSGACLISQNQFIARPPRPIVSTRIGGIIGGIFLNHLGEKLFNISYIYGIYESLLRYQPYISTGFRFFGGFSPRETPTQVAIPLFVQIYRAPRLKF